MTTASTALPGILADRILKQTDARPFANVDDSGTLADPVERATSAARSAQALMRSMVEMQTALARSLGAANTLGAMAALVASHGAAGRGFTAIGTSAPLLEWALPPFALDWVDDAKAALRDLISGLDTHEAAKDKLYSFGEQVLTVCASSQEPSVDLDNEGNIEIYFKEQAEGLLIVIDSEGTLHVFGSSLGESWRSSYSLSGNLWKQRLRIYLIPFIQHV